jgi:uncharacterized protein
MSTILWRRIDCPGHEFARLQSLDSGYCLSGTAVFVHDTQPCRMNYSIDCDSEWRTISLAVQGWISGAAISRSIRAAGGRWLIDGVEAPQVSGCIDVDLNFSPSTNLLSIRRLNLQVGESANVLAAWLRFPELTLEPLAQRYQRTGEVAYQYVSNAGAFARDLKVDHSGFVLEYPGYWQAESVGR